MVKQKPVKTPHETFNLLCTDHFEQMQTSYVFGKCIKYEVL
jgi:hypothetical protein